MTKELNKQQVNPNINWDTVKISNALMFKHVMKNEKLCVELLETILDKKIAKIVYKESEKEIDVALDSKSVRLDVYLEGDEKTAYDLEMQATNEGDLGVRSRYYQGMIDINAIQRGTPYTELPDSFVIFICDFDLFKKGRSIYTFQNICLEDTKVHLDDKTTKIFLNSKSDGLDVSEDLKAFLDFVRTNTASNDFTKRLESEMDKTRKNEDWRKEYMSLYVRDQIMFNRGKHEGLELGRHEGSIQKLIELLVKKVKKNKSLQVIADELEVDVNEIKDLLEIVKKHAPDYSIDAIVAEVITLNSANKESSSS